MTKKEVIIKVENLTKKFGDLIAVDHISFEVNKGEIFGLLGPNGAGKSTTIRMLCTLTRPTQGKAEICGFDIVREAGKVREHIGLVAEKIILYDRLTAAENLRLFGKLHHRSNRVINQQIDKLLKLVRMEEWKNHLTGTFSTGMRQRVNIARALLNEPEVLFLDEPTLGLDPQTTRTIREFILQLRDRGITMVLTTHIMAEAEFLCDRIGIIDHGKIVAMDTPQNLKKLVSQSETTILNLNISNLTNEMIHSLKKLNCVSSISQKDVNEIRLCVKGGNSLDKIIDVIRSKRGKIKNIATVEPTLEDVFLHLTGREMRDEPTGKIKSTPHGRIKPRSRIR